MLSDEEFSELMQQTRAGDENAALRLVRLYEPEIRRAARLRMTDVHMRRLVDSMDICQSVFGRFFSSASEGAIEIKSPQQLLALLTKMTRNRVIDEHRKNTSQKRAAGGHAVPDAAELLVDADPGPRTQSALREQLDQVRARLEPDELNLLERRMSGESWAEIAQDFGESPDSVRKRLERALARVRQQLGEAD